MRGDLTSPLDRDVIPVPDSQVIVHCARCRQRLLPLPYWHSIYPGLFGLQCVYVRLPINGELPRPYCSTCAMAAFGHAAAADHHRVQNQTKPCSLSATLVEGQRYWLHVQVKTRPWLLGFTRIPQNVDEWQPRKGTLLVKSIGSDWDKTCNCLVELDAFPGKQVFIQNRHQFLARVE